MKPRASVIIPTYNRRELLRRALLALAESTVPFEDFEVIVVDDGSTDGTTEMINSLGLPYDLAYERHERKGPAGARNLAIKLARGEIMIFIDSDILVVPEFVGAHLAAHKEPKVVAVGPVVHTDNLDDPYSTPFKLTDISGAFFATGNASVAKEHLLEAGLFDEAFNQYGWEDLELGHRLRKLGLRKVKVPEAVGYHYKERLKVASLPRHRRREWERGRMAVVFVEKDPSWATRLQVEMSPIMFGLDRLLSIGNWPNAQCTQRWLQALEDRGWHWLVRVLVRLITHHDYMEGMREALREREGARKGRLSDN
ncbi:MAG: glycosyltransferase [Firmicutes bacterium]|jgi:glycosyltransferase involved in cell wall biosynthesis|nr:glycosyltransferase [Bacillota bacterium]